jgi:hypothetical protein
MLEQAKPTVCTAAGGHVSLASPDAQWCGTPLKRVQVESINLAGIDRVVVAFALDDTRALLRQYSIKFKKSGTKVI